MLDRPGQAREPVAAVIGIGSALPLHVLTNGDLETMVETSDQWITERTGIKTRRLAAPEEATSDLATLAARAALADAGLCAGDIDLIVVATATPDHLFPATACLVQEALGAKNAAAMDVSAACTGFIYGLAVAEGAIATGRAHNVLLIGAETLSRFTDYQDRTTCILFGDGAGAAIVAPAAAPAVDPAAAPVGNSPGTGILSIHLGSDGSGAELLSLPAGGSRRPAAPETVANGRHYIQMNGPEVFRFAVGALIKSFKESSRLAGIGPGDVDLLIPHQANARIIDAAVRFMRVPETKVFHTIETYGNISSASIPVSLVEARRQGRLKPGDVVSVVAFGAGLTYGGAVIRWGGNGTPIAGQAAGANPAPERCD